MNEYNSYITVVLKHCQAKTAITDLRLSVCSASWALTLKTGKLSLPPVIQLANKGHTAKSANVRKASTLSHHEGRSGYGYIQGEELKSVISSATPACIFINTNFSQYVSITTRQTPESCRYEYQEVPKKIDPHNGILIF